MNRLGIWGHKTPFREFGNFIQAVERRQVFYFYFLIIICRGELRYLFKRVYLRVGLISEVLGPWRL